MKSELQFVNMEFVSAGDTNKTNKLPEPEIEFGNLEHSQPATGLRPDQDRHFCVADCGTIRAHDLPIYVDMDVLRDMESHARENTRVELGGVMLGRHHVDSEGKAFVVVTDSLRARHYEATRGSFKFTHDTWNQITRERNEFRKDLEMVGWYHTHPGWGIFLSGMDLFICNHFFNRPLDVALVIDPCAGERGWFQWSASEPGKTERTSGFHLMTNRHRRNELNYFNDAFSGRNPQLTDPRFRQNTFLPGSLPEMEDTMINLVDNRRSLIELAIVSMLLLQLLVVGLIGWRLTDTKPAAESSEVGQRLADVESRLQADELRKTASVREQAYAEILDALVTAETGQNGLPEKYAGIASENRQLQENLEGQVSRAKLALQENDKLTELLSSNNNRVDVLQRDLEETRQSLELVKQDRDSLKAKMKVDAGETDETDETDEAVAQMLPAWVPKTLVGVGLVILGGIGGFLLNRFVRGGDEDDLRSPPTESASSSETAGESRQKSSALSFEKTRSASHNP